MTYSMEFMISNQQSTVSFFIKSVNEYMYVYMTYIMHNLYTHIYIYIMYIYIYMCTVYNMHDICDKYFSKCPGHSKASQKGWVLLSGCAQQHLVGALPCQKEGKVEKGNKLKRGPKVYKLYRFTPFKTSNSNHS